MTQVWGDVSVTNMNKTLLYFSSLLIKTFQRYTVLLHCTGGEAPITHNPYTCLFHYLGTLKFMPHGHLAQSQTLKQNQLKHTASQTYFAARNPLPKILPEASRVLGLREISQRATGWLGHPTSLIAVCGS
jgi:hypothetical protein